MKRTLAALMMIVLWSMVQAAEEKEEAKAPTDVSVEVAKVIKTTLTRSVTAYGVVEPDPGAADRPPARVRLSPAAAGILTEVHAAEGQHVNPGDVLFKLDSRAAEAAVAKAELAIKYAAANVERQKKLIAAEGTSEKQVLEAGQVLATAQSELADANVKLSLLLGKAPMAGTVVMLDARAGEAASESKVLAEIVDLDRLIAVLQVPADEAGKVKAGQKAKLNGAGREETIEGAVAYVTPVVNAATGTVLVRLALPKDSGLHLGEFLTARIVVEEHAGKLAVPMASVYTDAENKTTLSIVTDGVAKRKEVKLGLRDGGLVEVEGEGIAEGMTVVTSGSYALPEETRVHVSNTESESK